MATLLPFHTTVLNAIHDPATSDLLVLARGLGLRRVICTLLKIYDNPKNLVLLINASPEEETAIGEELGLMGCRRPGLRVVGYETAKNQRQELYKGGGIIAVTSRILVVDMLQNDIPIDLISGIFVLHAEKVTPLVLEAFVIRLYREKNKEGFVKAFTDQPEHITSGMSPLRNIMKELQIRRVHIFPRFHADIKKSLERRRADVIELAQDMSGPMAEIHGAIIQCMSATLADLRRSNTSIDLDDFNVENAYFRQFDIIVRKQLDPVWHKVAPRTKQLVNDLGTLRRLLFYLLTYDSLQFHAYLETLKEASNTTASGAAKVNHSPWMMTDAAHIIFENARRRCYTFSAAPMSRSTSANKQPVVIDLVDDEDAWAALDEMEGNTPAPVPSKSKGKKEPVVKKERPDWLPEGLDPVLEELPKWDLLTEILQEIEEEIVRQESMKRPMGAPMIGSNTVLVMTSSTRTSQLLTEFLSSADLDAPKGQKGREMMMQKLRVYLWWKNQKAKEKNEEKSKGSGSGYRSPAASSSSTTQRDKGISEALQRKDKEKAERNQSRRRVRGGAPAASPSDRSKTQGTQKPATNPNDIEEFWLTQIDTNATPLDAPTADTSSMIIDLVTAESAGLFEQEFDELYGLIPPEQTVLVRAYSDDSDDRMLAEVQPKFIVMCEPNMEFVRRVEVYRSSHPGLGVRVYHLVYRNSCEEHKYLAAIRKEKESFERMIKERATMLMPIYEERRGEAGRNDDVIKTISTRLAGGRRELNQEPSKVIVDMREFRSTLPSLLHAANILVIPATLTVGDYILTPEMYTQCELMSVHYKYPILLIEFEEDKAFSLDLITDMKSYAKPSGKYPPKKNADPTSDSPYTPVSVQSKLVLLTLSFPRLKIIWSSSPFATCDIFTDLKKNFAEPDPTKAVAVGAEEDPEAGKGVNTAAEELVRCLPGVTAKNVKWVMARVRNVRELCEMSLEDVQELLGAEPGKACYEFMHKGDRKKN
ncbi:hypothetical protein CC1G_02791 [Coprinopsis cinerea okayama7|uniref:ERCC4 domain-containing protein n=1 Tax=Coprinopsis cinerea (strain Okayama-7 / 130 / ATCC MYA-4618 / FGSC 9003) TaxID=240176 RepID=A8N021_COPC7|nr:hypothetical protein CC1G_02791 [Coprinopsis cinerea okayama7\|eukprot:XP_001828210.2 hypothetical protein CC1G_02791 [Coprinopsis cinerea okayama7\